MKRLMAWLAAMNERAADPADASPMVFDGLLCISLVIGTIAVFLLVKYGWALACLIHR